MSCQAWYNRNFDFLINSAKKLGFSQEKITIRVGIDNYGKWENKYI